jgi:hypothetical protein
LDAATTSDAQNADALYDAACAAALASEASVASNADRAKTYLDRAMTLLDQAVAHGYQNAQHLRTDVDLAALHDDSRFLALADRLEGPSRYASVWRADVEFESRLLAPERVELQRAESHALAAAGYRPVAIAAFEVGAHHVAGLARVRDVSDDGPPRILANSATAANASTVASVWHRPLVPDVAKEELAQRQATAAAALVRMGAAERVWPLLTHQPDPRLRSYLLDRLTTYGADPATVLAQLRTQTEVSRRRALVLATGEFARAKLLSADQQSVATAELAAWYFDDADAGIHAAAEWSLRQLGAQAEIAELRAAYATGQVVGDRQWYLTKEGGQTLVIVRPEDEFLMGSPVAEDERFGGPTGKNELRHRRRIGRAFAIGAHEVTVEQFQQFLAEHLFDRAKAREPDAPANMLSWYDAAEFCNWLSEREGISRDQWCYDPQQKFADGMRLYPDYLRRTGYRLPTEAEWEYACRAGTTTSRHFGETDKLLVQYAWYTKNSQDRWMLPVGSLKPNDWGLFDMYGNALEWSQDDAAYYRKDREWIEDKEHLGNLSDTRLRVLRGGAFADEPGFARSASRSWLDPSFRNTSLFGFRVARTYP